MWFFWQRNQYSETKRKPLGRLALHPSTCGLGARDEGSGDRCRKAVCSFQWILFNSPQVLCLTGITPYKAKAAANDKSSSDKQFPFPCHFTDMHLSAVVLISVDSSLFLVQFACLRRQMMPSGWVPETLRIWLAVFNCAQISALITCNYVK